MTANEKLTHSGLASFDSRCRTCVKVRGTSRHTRKAVSQTAFSTMPIKNSQQNPEVYILVGARPRGETFAKAAHRKSANVEDLEVFLKVLQTQCGNIPVFCGREE